MAQTNLIDVIRVKTGAEVVDTAFVKRYLSISTDTHDTLLNDLIIAAREEVEKASCLSLVLQTITAEWSAAYGDTRLPYPKIIAITSAKDNDDNTLTLNTGYTLKGQDKKIITGDFDYTVGTKHRKAREIKNFKQDMLINKELFNVALEYAS